MPETETSDRKCANLTVCAADQEYEAVAATPTSDRICRPVSAPCSEGMNETSAATGTSDRICQPVAASSGGVADDGSATGGLIWYIIVGVLGLLVLLLVLILIVRRRRRIDSADIASEEGADSTKLLEVGQQQPSRVYAEEPTVMETRMAAVQEEPAKVKRQNSQVRNCQAPDSTDHGRCEWPSMIVADGHAICLTCSYAHMPNLCDLFASGAFCS